MEKFNQLKSLIEATEADARKFYAGNNAAGTRLRKGLQEVKVLAQSIRFEVTEKKNA